MSRSPVLSLILCSRNDAYMGNARWRLETSLNYVAARLHELGRSLDVEILVTDWGSEVPLRDVLTLSPQAAPLVSFVHVPPDLAKRLQTDSPFPEVLALNAAARRATGSYIGHLDQDTLVGWRFLSWFFDEHGGAGSLPSPLSATLFFSNHRRVPYRFTSRSPELPVVERYIRWFGRRFMNDHQNPRSVYYTSGTGIWLVHRDLWHESGGFDERMIYMNKMGTNMLRRLALKYPLVNLGALLQYDFYHLEHYHPFAVRKSSAHRKVNPPEFANPTALRANGDDWGLAHQPLDAVRAVNKPRAGSVGWGSRFPGASLTALLATVVAPQLLLDAAHRRAVSLKEWAGRVRVPVSGRSVAALALLVMLAGLVFWPAFGVRPFGGDNLYVLSLTDRTPLGAVMRADPAFYPEWRPLAFLAVWLQYQWAAVSATSYVAVNLLLWAACGWLIYRIVALIGHSALAGVVAAGVVLSDPRAVKALMWIDERQTPMACLFGLAALSLVLSRQGRPLGALRRYGVLLLLVASALSKEYGLAFAGALAIASLWERRRETAWVAFASVAAYAALRLGIAGGARGTHCSTAGYFFAQNSFVCYEHLDWVTLKQMVYNAGATGVGTLLPALFTDKGQIDPSPAWLVVNLLCVLPAVAALWKKPSIFWLMGLVLVVNAGLSVMAYRDRNHLVGLCATGVAIGVGLSVLQAALSARGRRAAWGALLAVMLSLCLAEGLRTRGLVSTEVMWTRNQDPCLRGGAPAVDAAFVRRIKLWYGLTNPDCLGF